MQLENANSQIESLQPALRRLDCLIKPAIVAAEATYGPTAAADLYRGLYITPDEVRQLLARELGAPILCQGKDEGENPWSKVSLAYNSRLSWLARAFGLSRFDIDLVLIVLAPEIDLRYERLYAYLQNNVSRRRPSVELALNLLCPTAQAKLARRGHFAVQAPLIHHGLLHLIPDTDHLKPPLLAHYLKLDDQIVCLLLGQDSLDTRLAPFCQLMRSTVSWEQLFLDNSVKYGLVALGCQSQQARRPLRLYFHGPRSSGRRQTAKALGAELGMPFMAADLAQAVEVKQDWASILRLLFREAWFQGELLYLDGLDILRDREQSLTYQNFLAALSEDTGLTIMAGTQNWVPAGEICLGIG